MTRSPLLWLGPLLALATLTTYFLRRPAVPVWWNPLPTDVRVEPRTHSPETDCRAFLKALPANYRHDWITVPENWEEPRGRQIKVFYYGNTDPFRDRTPIVFFNGGPTYDSHATFDVMKKTIARYRLPFVFLDQRGTGCSSPYPRELNAQTVRRLAHYGSSAIVRDAEAVREKLLGKGRWKIYGQSAGGWMVFRYLELFPGSVAAAFAHGAALNVNEVDEMTARLKSQKRVAAIYFKKFPEDLKLLRAAQDRVPPDLCYTDGTTRVCGAGVLDALIINLGFGTRQANTHEWLQSLEESDDTAFRGWLDAFAKNFFFHTYVSADSYAGTVLGMLEGSPAPDQDACTAAQQRLQEEGDDPYVWPLNECRMELSLERKWIDLVVGLKARDPYRLPRVAEQLAHHPEVPLFLYASKLDSFVPVESYRHTLEVLQPRVHYREFPKSGHEGYYTESAIWRDLGANAVAP